MKSHIIHESQAVILVGGGGLDADDFALAKQWGNRIVAADGGAMAVLAQGNMPDAVIGDFDSFNSEASDLIPSDRLHKVAEQETTDFEKCLLRIKAPLILGIGFSGRRLDHELATLTALAKHPDRRCLLIGPEMVTFLAPPRLELELKKDDLVSFYPLGPVQGVSAGLEYPVEGITFSPTTFIGTSNRAMGPITAEFNAPNMLVMLSRDRADLACDMLMINPHFWSAY